MKRPDGFAYWLEDVPPPSVTLLSALQHVSLICGLLPIPLVVAREAGLSPEGTINLIAVAMLALGATSILQTLNRGSVGSGLLAPSSFSGAYLAPSLLAVKSGGLALVFGMMIFAGLVEAVLSRLLRYLRPFLPAEIAGFVVVLIGLNVGSLGVRYMLGIGAATPVTSGDIAVSTIALCLMVGLNVWGRGSARLFCALIGLIGGYAAAGLFGVLSREDFARVLAAPMFSLPHVGALGWSFDTALIVPFAIGAIAACLKTMGDLTACQRINDADWVRPDLQGISRGTLANAIGTSLAGLVGVTGFTTSSSNIGLSGATGVTSRRVAYVTGGLLIVLAFLPQFASLLAIMPRSLMGAMLMFIAAFIIVSGLQIVAARLLDVRRTFVIGLSLIVALAVDGAPDYFSALPAVIQPLVSSSLVAGLLCAIALNLVFRIGTRKVQRFVVPPGQVDPIALGRFIDQCGASWGARRDVIERTKFNLLQSIETLRGSDLAGGPLEVDASFDEFNVVLRLSYEGAPLALPNERPSNEEIIGSEDGERRLAGFMLRRFADRVSASDRNGRATVTFQFTH